MYKKIYLITALVFLSAGVAPAHSITDAITWTAEAGPVYGDDIGIDISTSGTIVFFNGSIDYTSWKSDTKHDILRGYVGVGAGPEIQLQLGFGEGGPSVRVKTTITGSPVEYPTQWFMRGFTLTAFCEADKDKVTGGLQLGIAIL
ncbi:MAG: hypothetical protein WCN95_10100 [bacterium]